MWTLRSIFLWMFAAGVTYYDLRYRKVPNRFVLLSAAGGFALAAAGGWSACRAGLCGMLLGFALLFPAFLLRMVGGGDVKSLAVIGLATGLGGVALAMAVGIVAGGVVLLLMTVLPHAAQRVNDYRAALVDPFQASYQVRQALGALAQGGLFGVGLGQGVQKFGALPLVGDARATLDALREGAAAAKARTAAEYGDRVESLKAEWDAAVDSIRAVETPENLTQANVIGIVNEASGPRDVVVCAAGGMPGDLLKLWRPVDPKGYHMEYGFSCMGYEIAGGLGVKMADPSRDVFVMVGDGSYLMLHTEIVTSLEEGQKIIIVVVDNSGYQCIRNLQMSTGSPSYGNELRYRDPKTGILDGPYIPIDFAANAARLGAVAIRAET